MAEDKTEDKIVVPADIKEVSKKLLKKKISAELIDLKIINPLDAKSCINSAKKTKKVFGKGTHSTYTRQRQSFY